MVSKVIKFFTKESSGLHQAAYLLGFFAILSQLLALLRDRLLASSFGAGLELDLYYAAFRIPDFIFISVASVVSVSVLIPFLIEKLDQGKEEGKKFIDNIFSFFFLLIISVSIVAFFATPYLLKIIFPGFSLEEQSTLITLTRILLLSPIFLGFSNLLASVTQSFRRFFIYALSPLFYNLGIIFGIIALAPVWGILGVVYGVILGAVLHFAIQMPFVLQKGFLPRLTFNWHWKTLKKVATNSVPRAFTLSINHIAIIALLGLASLMVEGSIAVFNLSFNLQSVPLSIVGVSYSLAAFPTLSRLFAKGDKSKFFNQVVISARHIIFWSLPIMVLFIVLRAQIVRTILGAGEFGWDETRLTAAALAIFSVSILFQSLVLLFVRGFYSAGNTVKPLLISIFSGLTIVLSAFGLVYIFEKSLLFKSFIEVLLRVEGLESGILMLPLAYSLGFMVNALLLWFFFYKDYGSFSAPVFRTFFQSLSAAVFAGFAAYLSLGILSNVFDLQTFWGIFLQGFFSGILGIIVGALLLLAMDNEELKEIWKSFHKKFIQKNIIGPDANVV